jgi:aryl-phospho-beta-D-glucosidase BglC (GH1 family)
LGPPVHRITGWLHVVGTSLADERGNAVRLISILVPGMNRGDGRPGRVGRCPGWQVPPTAAYADIPRFGFNSVRLGIAWANLEPTPPTEGADGRPVHHYNQPYIQALDAIVRGFASHGVAVVLDMVQVRWSPAFLQIELPGGNFYHCGVGMPAWLYPNGGGVNEMVAVERAFFAQPSRWKGLIDAWTFLARRYARQPMVVGADIMNEPYDLLAVHYAGTEGLTPASLDLQHFYTTVGSAIARANPHLLLVYEDKRLNTGHTALVGPPELPNAVYSVHVYPPSWGEPKGRALTQFYADRAAAWGAPMWIGEFTAFGYTDPTGGRPNWQGDLRAFLAFCRQRNIGWTIASYSGNRLLIKGTTSPKPIILDILRTGL